MKEEDTDWLIYHLIAREPSVTMEGLVLASGLDSCAVEGSLERLDRCLLIDRTDEKVRVLSTGDSLIRCQVKYTDNLPYTIDHGVIKERKK